MRVQRVLVAPLDWGLGHATRCVPIIRELLRQNCEVVVGGSGHSLSLLKTEFPALKFFELAPYAPVYSASSSLTLKMAQQLNKFIRTICQEHRQTEDIVNNEKIDLVISDNRYGCWSRKAKSIFITHQLTILLPQRLKWMESMINYFNHRQIRKFNECWIPDYNESEALAGILSRAGKFHARYIGPLSRFEKRNVVEKKIFEIIIILSGPEPQRTLLEEMLLQKLNNTDKVVCLIRGVSGRETRNIGKNITVVDFLYSKDLQSLIQQASVVISRSGYSTIMDMSVIGGKVIFIPTPGQTEQAYLAQRFKEKNIAFFMQQNDFDLRIALDEANKYSGFKAKENDGMLLRNALLEILNNKSN